MGFAISESQRFATVGISGSWAWNPKFSVRVRGDHALSTVGSNWDYRNSSYNSEGVDFLWHKNGFKHNGLILGVGYSAYQIHWEEATPGSNPPWRARRENLSGPHFLAGSYVGNHFHFEGRINLITGSDTLRANLLGTIGWNF
jgi:hypothetical protein